MSMNSNTVIGDEISMDEIIKAASAQREQEQTVIRNTGKTVGRFAFDPETQTVNGPAEYMIERYAARMARINAGDDMVASVAFAQHGDSILAVLVSLQTDFAAWLGMRQFSIR